LSENLKGKDHFGVLGIDEKIILLRTGVKYVGLIQLAK
jgi:hypothetical protein